VEVHSFTLSHTPGSMKCDSWASLLARTFASLCLGHEPKARVAIKNVSVGYLIILFLKNSLVGAHAYNSTTPP